MSERIPVGTRVKVAPAPQIHTQYWGRGGVIEEDDCGFIPYRVVFDDGDFMWFGLGDIEPLPKPPEPAPIFAAEAHIGDKSTKYRITASYQSIQIGLHGNGIHQHIFLEDLPRAVNFIRALMDAVEYVQPGVFRPLPDGDPSIVDAMKVLHEADSIQGETR